MAAHAMRCLGSSGALCRVLSGAAAGQVAAPRAAAALLKGFPAPRRSKLSSAVPPPLQLVHPAAGLHWAHGVCIGSASSEPGSRRAYPPGRKSWTVRWRASVASPERDQREERTRSLWTVPNVLTVGRVAAVPALVAVFYTSPSAAAIIFAAASATDWLDGYLARKTGAITAFGAFLDPVADKLMVAAALLLLCTSPPPVVLLPWVLPSPSIAIIGREIAMSAVRELAASQGGDTYKAVAVSSMGKWKTATQMVAVSTLLTMRVPGLEGAVLSIGTAAGVGLLYAAAGLAVVSLAQYMRAIWGYLL